MSLTTMLYRDGDVIGPAGVLRAWAEFIRSAEKEQGWASCSVEWKLAHASSGGGELTPPEAAVDSMSHAEALGGWCAAILADCDYLQRRVARHRYVDAMSWEDIATQLGGRVLPGVAAMTAQEAEAVIEAVHERLRRAIRAAIRVRERINGGGRPDAASCLRA